MPEMTDDHSREPLGVLPDGTASNDGVLIEISIAEPKQLFNSIDPSPFREKDLDPAAENFIIDWAREAHHRAPLSLRIHVTRPTAVPDESAGLVDAVHEFFRARARPRGRSCG
jgi:hypothetical protein